MNQSTNIEDIHPDTIKRHKDFQSRQGDLDLLHLRQLASIAASGQPLSRILVWQDINANEDNVFTLLDGRYRLEAYQKAGWGKPIPVKIIRCTRHDAMLLATKDAIKDRLNLTQAEKTDRAWRLVRDKESTFSKSEISRATGVGTSTVGRMRRRLTELTDLNREPTGYWWKDRVDAIDEDDSQTGELTASQRKAIIAKIVPQIRDALDWRKWEPSIPDENLQYEIISEVLGERKMFSMLEWCLGGDQEKTEDMIKQWKEDYTADDYWTVEEADF